MAIDQRGRLTTHHIPHSRRQEVLVSTTRCTQIVCGGMDTCTRYYDQSTSEPPVSRLTRSENREPGRGISDTPAVDLNQVRV